MQLSPTPPAARRGNAAPAAARPPWGSFLEDPQQMPHRASRNSPPPAARRGARAWAGQSRARLKGAQPGRMRRAWIASAAAPGLGNRTFICRFENPPTVAGLLGICHVDERSQQQHHQDAVQTHAAGQIARRARPGRACGVACGRYLIRFECSLRAGVRRAHTRRGGIVRFAPCRGVRRGNPKSGRLWPNPGTRQLQLAIPGQIRPAAVTARHSGRRRGAPRVAIVGSAMAGLSTRSPGTLARKGTTGSLKSFLD